MKEYISTAQLAELIGVTKQAIHYWRKTGMPYHKFGTKTFRYKLSEIRDWQEKAKDKNNGKEDGGF